MKRIASFQKRHDGMMVVAWICALCLAVLQAHFFLSGYRLTGDDVLLDNVMLHGGAIHYIVQTATEQGRIGHYVSLPMSLLGAYFSDYLAFRIFYVTLWYVDMLMFSAWVARIARARIALPVFVSAVVIQPMIGYHMPPVGYPLALGMPLLIMLGTRLLLAPGWATETQRPSMAGRMVRWAMWILYALALLCSEYMMIFGLILVTAEISAGETDGRAQPTAHWWTPYRRDFAILAAVYVAYVLFRLSHPSHYDGIGLNGIANFDNLLHTFIMHIASGTWLPFAHASMLSPSVLVGSFPAVLLCCVALLVYWRAGRQVQTATYGSRLLSSAALVLGIVAITLPVVAASKQQQWCVVDHNCSYLDSRLSLFLLIAAIALGGLSLCRSSAARRCFRGAVFLSLVVSAAIGYAVNSEQTQGMKVATEAWTRARRIACIRPKLNAVLASRYIDPNHYIPMHTIMNRDAFWSDYMDRVASQGRCLSQTIRQPRSPTDQLLPGAIALASTDGSGLDYLGSGWSHPESNGIWTDGPSAMIEARIVSSGKSLRLILLLRAYAPGSGQSQLVTATVNTAQRVRWNVTDGATKPYAIDVPAGLAKVGGHLTVRLDIAHPTSPLQRHQSTDQRQLGVFLSSLQLQAVGNSP